MRAEPGPRKQEGSMMSTYIAEFSDQSFTLATVAAATMAVMSGAMLAILFGC